MSKVDSEYVLDRISSIQRVLEKRADSESTQAMVELAIFRSKAESAHFDETTPPQDDIIWPATVHRREAGVGRIRWPDRANG